LGRRRYTTQTQQSKAAVYTQIPAQGEDQRNGDVATVGFIPLETSGAGSFWDICGLYWHKKRSFPTPPLNLPADRHAPLTGYKI
jgi:hypothetical protein